MPPSQPAVVARAWLARHVPGAFKVIAVGRGITGTKWLVRRAEGDPLMLRWADPETWGATGREHARREALACELLAGSGLPVPRVLAADPEGAEAGGPAVLLTWRPGRVRLDPLGPRAMAALARLAVAVHRVPVPPEHRPPTLTLRGPAEPVVPTWTTRPEVWKGAISLRAAGLPPTRSGLIHRDFHLGNVLWTGDEISGVIDWAETSWGPPDLDVAHLCSDFAMLHGVAAAETFRAAYVHAGGSLDSDPAAARFWTAADVVGFLPDPAHVLPAFAAQRPELTAADVRRGLEDLLVATLGRT